MPFSSADIAAATGAFVQQHAANMQYSQMIGTGGFQPAMADAFSGSMMSRGMGAAGPLVGGAMGLMGLDPMSLGMRAGMGVLGRGGSLMGAGMAGLGVAGGASLGIYAAQKAGEQMMLGAQQQQQLNTSLRQNFNFQTANGQGFNRSDMTQIGSNMRAMTHQFGAGGEVTSMSELVQLAGGMGRMGMAGGVRDAQEFSRKFREMVSTLKSVAQELGTSLQEAQQFMSAQKSSGIFKFADQSKFASQARGASMAGGLALSEVTAMASIGSQISRSVGGLGRSGAFGGMRTIGQIGSATQVGALSEEDIYNATGLTGAEGRQALSTSMMSRSANFLKSGRGRHFLASMAGADGNLDSASVAAWESGGMDVGETRAMAGRNLAGVGRANFIRNEGRLRGAALEKFGGMAQTMAYSQWLGSKGYDPSSMDDRSMLAFQRFSGMGRDEADAAIKMVRGLPEIMAQQRNSAMDDKYSQSLGTYRKTHGVEGAKRAIEQLREKVQGKIQGVGQDLYNSATDMVEQLFNKAMGITERRVSDNIGELWRAAKMGGSGGATIMAQLGTGGRLNKFGGGAGGGGGLTGGVGMQEWAKHEGMRTAADVGTFGSTKEITDFASSSRGWMRDLYTSELAGKTGTDRMSSFGKALASRAAGGDVAAKGMLAQWQQSGDVGRAGMLASMENASGISGEAGLSKSFASKDLGFLSGEFSSLRQGDIATGRAMLGRSAADTTGQVRARKWGGEAISMGFGGLLGTAKLGAMAADRFGGGSTNFSAAVSAAPGEFARGTYGRLTGSDEHEAAAGAYLRSAEGGGLMMKAIQGQGREELQNKYMDLQAREGRGEHLSDAEQGQKELFQSALLANSYAAFKSGKISTKELIDQIGRGKGPNPLANLSKARAAYEAIGGQLFKQAQANQNDIVRREMIESHDQMESARKLGVMTMDDNGKYSLSAKTMSSMEKHGFGYLGKHMDALSAAKQSLTGDATKDADILQNIQSSSGQMFDDISRLSIAQKRNLARDAVGTDAGAMAADSMGRERRLTSAVRGKRGNVAAGMASTLGLDLSKDDMSVLKGMSNDESAAFIASKFGIKDDAFQKELAGAIGVGKSGKLGQAADQLARGVSQSETAKKAIQEAQKDKDPQAQMVDAIKQGNRYLEALVKSNDSAKTMLAQIAGNTASGAGNAEGEEGTGTRH